MPEIVYSYLFWSMMGACVGGIAWTLLSLPFMFALPREFMQKYFSQPHFNKSELAIFSAFPANLIRNVMFVRLIASPSSGRVRGLAEAYKDVSSFIRAYAKFLYGSLLFVLLWLFGTGFIMVAVITYDNISKIS